MRRPGSSPLWNRFCKQTHLHITSTRTLGRWGGRAIYLSADRPDIQYCAKEINRWMSAPTDLSLTALKRLCRLPFQQATHVDVYSDTDWAGCVNTRKSTSGGPWALLLDIGRSRPIVVSHLRPECGRTAARPLVYAIGLAWANSGMYRHTRTHTHTRCGYKSACATGRFN